MRKRVLPAVGTAAVLSAVLLAPPPAAGEPDVVPAELLVHHTCVSPSGEHPVDVRITATLPESAAAGAAIEVSDAAVTFTPPVADLPGATALTAVVRQTATVLDQAVAWSGDLAEPTPTGEITVALDAPPVATARAGEVTFTAGDVILSLAGHQADGTPTEPPVVDLTCTPVPDQDLVLGSVAVTVGSSSGPGVSLPPGVIEVHPPTGADRGERSREGGISPLAAEIPPDCQIIDPPPGTPTAARYCAYITGVMNVTKLNASVVQPPGIVNIGPTQFAVCPPGNDATLRCQYANILANLDGEPKLPETEGSFIAFGFVPTKAKMQLTQVETALADIRLDATAGAARSVAVIPSKFVARLYDASVNGVPMDLGENCVTERPVEVELRGYPPYRLTTGGELTGSVVIPPFTGCGVTEDLGPLITGLVSGPNNYVKMVQGPICTLTGAQTGCPPVIPALPTQ